MNDRINSIRALRKSILWLDEWKEFATKREMKVIISTRKGLVYALREIKKVV